MFVRAPEVIEKLEERVEGGDKAACGRLSLVGMCGVLGIGGGDEIPLFTMVRVTLAAARSASRSLAHHLIGTTDQTRGLG